MLLHISIVYSLLMLSDSPSYEVSMIYLSIPCSWTSEILSMVTTNKFPVNINIQVWYGHMFSFLLSRLLGLKWLGHVVGVYLSLKNLLKFFSKVVVSFSLSPTVHENYNSSTVYQHLICHSFKVSLEIMYF